MIRRPVPPEAPVDGPPLVTRVTASGSEMLKRAVRIAATTRGVSEAQVVRDCLRARYPGVREE